jgi:hypothetical protein
VVGWLRRVLPDNEDDANRADSTSTGQSSEDSPEALSAKVEEQVRSLNRNAGQLPASVMVEARQLTDTLSAIVRTSETRPLDIYAVIMLRNVLDDYLPTAVTRYVAVPAAQRDTAGVSGATPTSSLRDQIHDLLLTTVKVREAAENADVDAVMTHGAFLRTKFSGSDLDL